LFEVNGPELRAKFERDGFVVVKGVFSAGQCGDMIQVIEKLLPERFSLVDPQSWTGRVQDCCNNLPLYQRNGLLRYKDREGFRHIRAIDQHIYSNPRLKKLFNAVTGRSMDRLHVRGLHPVLRMPRWVSIDEAFGNRLSSRAHALQRPWLKIPCPPQLPIPGHLDVHPVDVHMMIYLDHVRPRGGGLTVWPRSHRLLQHCFSSLYEFFPTAAYKRSVNFLQRFRPLEIIGHRGDLIILHNRLLHSNSRNHDVRIRHAVLLDVFGNNWLEQDRRWKNDQTLQDECRSLAGTKKIESHPLAAEIARHLAVDPTRAFLSKHPRLVSFFRMVAKDPLAAARRGISAKIRSRREGDCWIVVSQGWKHKRSPKLDAYGTGAMGQYLMTLNGDGATKSDGGVLVERIEPVPGKNAVEITGNFLTDHYVRIIRSRNPLSESEILYSGVIQAGAFRKVHDFNFDAPADVRSKAAA
jgi:hypothetical protein